MRLWTAAAAASFIGIVLGYLVAEWNIAHSCSDAIYISAQWSENMEPFRNHPDDSTIRSRLEQLQKDFRSSLERCRGSFLIR